MIYGDIDLNRMRGKAEGGTHAPSAVLNLINALALILCMAAFSMSLYELFFPNTMASGMAVAATVVGRVALISSAAILLLSAKSISAFALSVLLYLASNALTGSDAAARMFILFTVSISLCAFMVTAAKKSTLIYILVSPFAAFIATFALCRNLGFSALSLLPFAVGIAMGVMTKYKCRMSDVMVASSLIVIFVICASCGVALYVTGISLGELAQSIRELLISAIEAQFIEAYPQYLANMSALGVDPAVSASMFNEMISNVTPTVISIVNLTPAITVCIVTVAIYFARSVQTSFLARYGGEEYITADTVVVQMSFVSAVVFIVSAVFSQSTDVAGVPDMVSAVASNVMLIIMPGLIYTGFFSSVGMLLSLLKKKQLFATVLLLGLIAITLYAMLPYIFHILAFAGAIFVIIRSVGDWATKNINKGDV